MLPHVPPQEFGSPVGVGVAVPVPVGVGVGVAVPVPVGVGVALPVAVGEAVGDERVKDKLHALVGDTASAFGLLLGAFGATDCCLNSYKRYAVKIAIPARITVATIIKIVPILLTGFFIFLEPA